jgi:hypothetical protein
MIFSDTVNNTGIVQQTRSMMRVDAIQWPTYKIVNSVNNYLDTVTGFAIGADRKFQWDDTNHTKLPIGTTDLIGAQAEYSFLADEQGNSILSLTRIDILTDSGEYKQLKRIDITQIPMAVDEYKSTPGIPQEYDLIADNIVKLYPKPSVTVANGLKFYFQRTPSYFTASDTTKAPGVSPLLHRGFVIASAYDGALTLGLKNLQALSVEMAREEQKMKQYFLIRNTDEPKRFGAFKQDNR